MANHRIEIFIGNCPLCEETVQLIQALADSTYEVLILVVQKSPESLMYRESHAKTGVSEKGMTWDAQVSTQKATPNVYPPTLSSTASSIESMDCP